MKDVEDLINRFLLLYEGLLTKETIKWTKFYVDHNECGLAYDCLIFEVEKLPEAMRKKPEEDLMEIASCLSIVFPALSTD